jgi:hypothetical protein
LPHWAASADPFVINSAQIAAIIVNLDEIIALRSHN